MGNFIAEIVEPNAGGMYLRFQLDFLPDIATESN